MPRPISRARIMVGPPTLTVTMIASRAMSRTSASFTRRFLSPKAVARRTSPRSHRHPHDFLIGGDDAVAHGHHGLQRPLGVAHRGNDVGQLRLLGDRGDALLLADRKSTRLNSSH